MSDNEHSGEKVLLYVLIGIGIFGLAYLFFKDQFKRQDVQQSSLGVLGRTTSQLAISNPRIDELERQITSLEMQTEGLKERSKLYDYQINQLSNVKNNQTTEPRMYQLSGQPSRAGSVTTIRTTGEDKVRQKDFGMN